MWREGGTMLDARQLDITCPGCGKNFKEQIEWIRRNRQLSCPMCGVTIHTTQFARDIGKAEKKVEKIDRDLKRP